MCLGYGPEMIQDRDSNYGFGEILGLEDFLQALKGGSQMSRSLVSVIWYGILSSSSIQQHGDSIQYASMCNLFWTWIVCTLIVWCRALLGMASPYSEATKAE